MGKEAKLALKKNINMIALILVYALLVFILQLATDGVFFKARNISNLLRSMAYTTILASGIFFVLLTGHIDLTVGWLMGLLGAVSATLMVNYGMSTFAAIGIAMLIGVAAGALHGFLVAQVGMPAFIATLGAYMVYKGLLIGITHGATIAGLNESYNALGQAYIPRNIAVLIAVFVLAVYAFSVFKNRKNRSKYNLHNSKVIVDVLKIVLISVLLILFVLFLNSYEGVPVPVGLMAVFVVIIGFVAKKTPFGREMYAIGGNVNAAKYAGINAKRNIWIAFIISGFSAACASVVYTARLGAASTQAGNCAEMDAIAACVVGGTSLAGGVGNAPMIVLGALFMMTIDNGMSLLNVSSEYQYIVKGVVLILAVAIDTLSNKKRS